MGWHSTAVGYSADVASGAKYGTAVGNTGTLFLLLAVILTPLMLLFGNTLIRFMQTPHVFQQVFIRQIRVQRVFFVRSDMVLSSR